MPSWARPSAGAPHRPRRCAYAKTRWLKRQLQHGEPFGEAILECIAVDEPHVRTVEVERPPLQSCEAVARRGLLDQKNECRRENGFGEVAKRAVFDGLAGRLECGLPRREDHGDIQIVLAHTTQEFHPSVARHVDVAHDDVEGPLLEKNHRFTPILRGLGHAAMAFERNS